MVKLTCKYVRELYGLWDRIIPPDWGTTYIGIDTNQGVQQRVLAERLVLDQKVFEIIQREIFSYYKQAYERRYPRRRLSFDEGRINKPLDSKSVYWRRDKGGPIFEVDIESERSTLESPKQEHDYMITVELKKLPIRGKYYKLILQGIKDDLPKKLSSLEELKDLAA